MPLCLLWSECFEETFENSHRRKDKIMQPVPICISPSRKFEEAIVKQWREERQTLLHFFCGLQHAGWLFWLVPCSRWQNPNQKSESFSLNISLWDISAFPVLAGILVSSIFFWLIKSINAQRNIREKYSEKIPSEYEYEYYSVWENHPNTNTNNIRFEKLPEYEYE